MTSDHLNTDDRREGMKVERDHPQTRKAEPDARGSSKWREDVVPPEGEREEGAKQTRVSDSDQESLAERVGELAEEAETVRRQAAGARTGGEAPGSGAGRDVGSGTPADKGDLGDGGQAAGNNPDGAESLGVASKE